MQVTSNTAYTPQVNPGVNVDTQTRVNRQGEQLLVREQEQQAQQRQQNEQSTERFDVDEQAIALVEQEQQRQATQSQTNENNASSFSAQYDQPSQQNQTAVAAYQSVNDQQQRDSVSQAFGVDLYA